MNRPPADPPILETVVFIGSWKKWLRVAERFIRPGVLLDMAIMHDPWCRTLRSGQFDDCNCRPEVKVTRLQQIGGDQ